MRSEPLYRVRIITIKNYLKDLLEKLYNFGLIHIDEVKEEKALEYFKEDFSFENFTKIAELLAKINSTYSSFLEISKKINLKLDETFTPDYNYFTYDKLINIVEEASFVVKVGDKVSKIYDEIERLNILLKYLNLIESIILKPSLGKGERVAVNEIIEKIRSRKIEEVKAAYDLLNKGVILSDEDKKLIETFIKEEINKVFSERDKLVNELKKIIIDNWDKVKKCEFILKDIYNYLSVQRKIKSSRVFCIIEGYVPRRFLQELKKTISNIPAILLYEEVKEGPVLILYPKLVKPFSFFTKLYGLPKFGHLDPTIIFYIFFPMFMGMALGDGGYGIILLVLSLILYRWAKKKKFNEIKDMSIVLIYCSIWGIFWGILFGSIFSGLVPVKSLIATVLGIEYKGLFPITKEGAMIIMGISILIGLVHSNLALLFKIINEKSISTVLFDVFPLVMIELLFINLFLTKSVHMGLLVLTLVGVCLCIYKHNLVEGFIKILEFITGILSYIRLAALALAAFGMDLAFHHIVEMILPKELFLIGVSISTLFAFGIHVLPSFIHSLRLHYVEMFRLYYKETKNIFIPYTTLIRNII